MESYCYNIEDLNDALYSVLLEKTDEKSKQRIERYKSLKDKKRSLISHWLLKLALSEKTGENIKTQKISRTKNGKPFDPERQYFINTSHSKDLVVCVIDQKPISIDIEYIRPVSRQIVKNLLGENIGRNNQDLEKSRTIFNKEVLTDFFSEWTRREAYLKLNDLPLSSVRVRDLFLSDRDSFKTVIKDNYVITVCYKRDDHLI